MSSYPSASLKKDDKKANILIWTVSAVVFAAVVILHELKIEVDLGFDPHFFARLNAIINGSVATLLILGLYLVKSKKFMAHKRVMNLSIILSVVFLVSYIAHHILADSTVFRGEGSIKTFYYFILITHIILSVAVIPLVLTSYSRAVQSNFQLHKKIAKITFPIWLYVAVTGVVVYLMISPYY